MSKRKSLPACIRADARFTWDRLERNTLVYLTVCEMMHDCKSPPSHEALSYSFKIEWSQAASFWGGCDATERALLEAWNNQPIPHDYTFGRCDCD